MASARLYKHISETFADRFERGSVRIGTLSDFRNQESHRPGIGDEHDAAYIRTMDMTIADTSSQPDVMRKLREARVLQVEGDVRNIHFTRSRVEEFFPDAYVFCVSTQKDSDIGYDAVFEISEAKALSEILGRRLHQLGITNECAHGVVKYETLEKPFLDSEAGMSHAFLKDATFAHQAEYRFVFYPVVRPCHPLTIEVGWPEGLITRIK